MDDKGRVDKFQRAQQLITEEANVFKLQLRILQDTVEIGIHQLLDDEHVWRVDFDIQKLDNWLVLQAAKGP